MADIRINIQKLDKLIREGNGTGTIQKSERISKSQAEEFLGNYAERERLADPTLSPETAFRKAMDACPSLGALSVGFPMGMVRKGGTLRRKTTTSEYDADPSAGAGNAEEDDD